MRRIWIVDDESNIGLSLRLILEREGVIVTTFAGEKNWMGLGLSIARRSVLLCGGEIEHRVSEMGGAAFVVTLPAAVMEAGNAKNLDR